MFNGVTMPRRKYKLIYDVQILDPFSDYLLWIPGDRTFRYRSRAVKYAYRIAELGWKVRIRKWFYRSGKRCMIKYNIPHQTSKLGV